MTDVKALFHYHLSRLWARRWSAMLAAWAACLAGWIAVAALPNKYASQAQIYVDTDNLLKPLLRDMAVQPDVNSNIELVRRTLLSPESLVDAVKALDGDLPRDQALAEASAIAGAVSLIPDRNAHNLFTVSFRAHDPKRAQAVVEHIVQLFIRRTRGISEDAVRQSRNFIDEQIKTYEARLRDAEEQLAAFQRAHAQEIADLSPQAFAQQQQTLEAQISQLTATYESKIWQRDQLKTDLARTPPTLSATQGAALSSLTPDQQRLEKMKADLAAMQQIYKDNYPDIVTLKRQIALAEEGTSAAQQPAVKRKAGTVTEAGRASNPAYRAIEEELRRVQADIVGTDRQVKAQRARLEQLRREHAGVPEVEQELAALNRDYDVLKKNYAGLIERRETANLTQNIETQGSAVAFRVIEKPSSSATPVWPPRKLLYPAVALMGVVVGLGLAFLRYFWSDLIATVGDLAAAAPGVVVLGSLTRAALASGARRAVWNSGFAALTLLLALSAGAATLTVPHFHDARSIYAAAQEAWWAFNRMIR